MKVLLLPYNIASIPSITAESLNKIPGVEAKCLSLAISKYHYSNKHTIYLTPNISRRNPFKWGLNKVIFRYRLKELIKWADVLHYTWNSALHNGEDLYWAKKFNKPVFVEWLGSDIRVPEKLYSINPYYKEIVHKKHEYLDFETIEKSNANQVKFANVSAYTLVCPEMALFLNETITKEFSLMFQRINCSDYKPSFPSVLNKRPLIVHSPTASIAKGTDIIMRVIDELKKDYEFDFVLIQNMPHQQALEVKNRADIFLDQIIIGSYGMAALEAMSQGKPVVAYIMPKLFELGLPADCPIISASPESLRDQLIKLITNSHLRHNIGKKSRLYVEKFHDANVLAYQLLVMYKDRLAKQKKEL